MFVLKCECSFFIVIFSCSLFMLDSRVWFELVFWCRCRDGFLCMSMVRFLVRVVVLVWWCGLMVMLMMVLGMVMFFSSGVFLVDVSVWLVSMFFRLMMFVILFVMSLFCLIWWLVWILYNCEMCLVLLVLVLKIVFLCFMLLL